MISSLDFYAPDISILLGEPLWGHKTSQNDHIRLSKDCILTEIGFYKEATALYFGNPNFFQTYTQLNLNSWIGGKQKPILVQMQSFDSRIWSFWLVVWPHNGSTRRKEMSGAEKSRLEMIPSTFHYYIQARNPPKCIQKLTTSNNFDVKNLV